MKIDSCDPPFLPGKQKRRAVVISERVLSMCAWRGATRVNDTRGGGGVGVREVSDKEDEGSEAER